MSSLRATSGSVAIQKAKGWIASSCCAVLAVLAMTMLLSGCSGYKTPSLSGGPETMSAETLCFRAAGSRQTELEDEISRRNLDCAGLLQEDPLLVGPDEAVHRF